MAWRDLIDRLHRAVGRGLIALEAPAGAGKTRLIDAFLSELECDARYVVVDPLCTCPEVLAERILMALEPGKQVATRWVKLADLQLAIASSFRRSRGERPPILVFDNVEHLAGHPDSMAVIETTHEAMPRYASVVVSGRCVQSETLERLAMERGCLWLTREDFRAEATDQAQRGRSMRLVGGTTRGALDEVLAVDGPDVPSDLQFILHLAGYLPDTSRACLEAALGAGPAARADAFLRRYPGLKDPIVGGRGEHLRTPVRTTSVDVSNLSPADHNLAVEACSYLLNRGLPYHAAEMGVRLRSNVAQSFVLAALGQDGLRDGMFAILRRLIGDPDPSGAASRATGGLGSAIRARVELAAGDPQSALRLIDSVRQNGQMSEEALIHMLIAETTAAMVSADLPRAQRAAESLEKAAQGQASAIRFDALMSAGDYHLFIRSDTKKAEALYKLGLEFAEKLGHTSLLALAAGKLGDLAYTAGDITGAINSLEKAVALWRELGCVSRIGRPLNNLGMAYASAGNIQAAARSFRSAAQASRAECLDVREAYSLASLAELELGFGSTANARLNLDRALTSCSGGVIDERLRALVLADLALCDLKDGLNDRAHRLATRSAILAETSAGPVDRAICTSTLARVQFAMGLRDLAESTILDAIAVFEAAGAQGELVGAHLRLAVFAHNCGNDRRARQQVKKVLKLAKHGSHKGTIFAVLRQEHDFAIWVQRRRELGEYLDEQDWHDIGDSSALQDLGDSKPTTKEILYHRSSGTVQIKADATAVTLGIPPQTRALFELFLEHRDGVPAPDLRRLFDPADPENRGNSAMHTAIFRLERALFDGAVIREGEAIRLDPETVVKVA